MSITESADEPFVVAHATVEEVERISPSFMRLTFAGRDLDRVGTPGHSFDQRIKIIVPEVDATTVPIPAGTADWYATWLSLPEARRGALRTYTVRDLRICGTSTRLIVDIVVGLGRHDCGAHRGPGARWVRAVCAGDGITMVVPRRGTEGGGVEYRRDARKVLLAGDETALPAIARILEDAPRETAGSAFIEVPWSADIQSIDAPDGVQVTWLPRNGRLHGELLLDAVPRACGGEYTSDAVPTDSPELIWETVEYSSGGEPLPAAGNTAGEFFWIAGESRMVTALRRHLVTDLGIPRGDVAFMGYWRARTLP